VRELPPRARWYVVAVAAMALACVVVSALSYSGSWFAVLTFFVLFALADGLRSFSTSTTDVTVSVSFIVAIAAVAATGPYGACLVGLAGLVSYSRRRRWVHRLFNGSQFAVAPFVAGLAYAGWGSVGDELVSGRILRSVAATVLATIVYFVVNATLVAVVISITTGMSLRRVWAGSFSMSALSYCGYGMLGLLLAVLWVDVRVLAPIILMLPLLVARSAFANYSEERAAYDATVRALVHAVETKDFYTRGHSERVSIIAERISREAGLREDRVQVVRYAGMLHDIGKLGVSTKVLQKQGKLSAAEFEEIKLHPLRGYEMLCEIDFLHEALTGVYHHHERLDGRGYPMGLAGDEIPEFARVIMVADAFDSMTSTRSYRLAKTVEEAVAELRRCQDTQFDARMVDCLVAAVARHGWEPTPEHFAGEQVSRDGTPLVAPQGAGHGRGD
jgi:HD-GYP domain-containing protein (c-di-GMP phosphodiesterase class II)